MQDITPRIHFIHLLQNNRPRAMAWIRGDMHTPFSGNTMRPSSVQPPGTPPSPPSQISGLVKFYDTSYGGVLVEAEIFGLPNISTPFSSDFYGFHIHEVGDCSQNFTHTGNHYDPNMEEHPNHAGDMPPLLGNQGYAWMSFFDRRFTIDEIMGRSVVIHQMADDFHTQPSGNSGAKIACGVIRPV